MPATTDRVSPVTHVAALQRALEELAGEYRRIARWGEHLASTLVGGGRLLTAGNGGSAAHAQHLSSELVGRYSRDRPAFSAIALHTDTSAVTAIVNDYSPADVFSRQVAAHGRHGDVLLAISTSGRSANVIAAAQEAHRRGLTCWALTGGAPNPLAAAADDAIAVDCRWTCTVQEVHQVVVHLLCEAFEEEMAR